MKIRKDYPASHAVMTLEDGETLQRHVLLTGIQHVASDLAGFWNIDIELTPDAANQNRDMLHDLGFVNAGTLSTQTATLLRLRKPLRRSGDGGETECQSPSALAIPAPTLPVSDIEQAAVELVSRLNTDGVEAKAAKLKADAALMFDRPDSTPKVICSFCVLIESSGRNCTGHSTLPTLSR